MTKNESLKKWNAFYFDRILEAVSLIIWLSPTLFKSNSINAFYQYAFDTHKINSDTKLD